MVKMARVRSTDEMDPSIAPPTCDRAPSPPSCAVPTCEQAPSPPSCQSLTHDQLSDPDPPASAISISQTVVSSQVCGVFLGYPTLLVWAQVRGSKKPAAAHANKLSYVLGDGTPVNLTQIALNKSFESQHKRKLAAARLLMLTTDSTRPMSNTPLALSVHQPGEPVALHLMSDDPEKSGVPERDLSRLAGLHGLTHRELLLRRNSKRARKALPEERAACAEASRRLQEVYGVEIDGHLVFKAIMALGVSGAFERRRNGMKETFWCTDDFVLHYRGFLKNNLRQKLAIMPDPCDFLTASILDAVQDSGSLSRLQNAVRSRALTEDVFAAAPVLRRSLSG